MGTLVGHVAPGFGFFIIGLWHLFNHIKLHSLHPNSYTSLPWFPTPKLRYLELYLIMFACSISISMELFIGPEKHHPFDTDGTIPLNHLHNFEHSNISLTFFLYAAFAIILDRASAIAQIELTQLIASVAFGQQLLLFHLHSTDHLGVEGQYHSLLQILVVISLTTTLMGIGMPRNFLLGFLRSVSILFQGVWLMEMGCMLWVPEFLPKGCFLNSEEGHQVVRCSGEEALQRGKSLVNIQFSWFSIGVTIFATSFYLIVVRLYGRKVEYSSLREETEEVEEDGEDGDDLEIQKQGKVNCVVKSFIHMGKAFSPNSDMER